MEENNTKKESRECGKGEVIRRGANIQKYVDNYDRIFRKGAHRSTKAKQVFPILSVIEKEGAEEVFCAYYFSSQNFSGLQIIKRDILKILTNPRTSSPIPATEYIFDIAPALSACVRDFRKALFSLSFAPANLICRASHSAYDIR